MNREILFRGKRVDNGEWIVGNYYYDGVDNTHFINTWSNLPVEPETGYSELTMAWLQVIPETVGQYTGLLDKNWTKIFEGDILKSPRGINYPVTFKDGSFVAHLGIVFYTKDIWNNGPIVGNIHDNPELLK